MQINNQRTVCEPNTYFRLHQIKSVLLDIIKTSKQLKQEIMQRQITHPSNYFKNGYHCILLLLQYHISTYKSHRYKI